MPASGLLNPIAPVDRFDGQVLAFALSELASLIRDAPLRRPMLVVDRAATAATGVAGELAGTADWGERVFDAIEPNPTAGLARSALQIARRERADGLVAVGGGSCIDLAKAVAVGLDDRHDFGAINRGEQAIEGAVPLIAVPTTAGSGSQATSFGVLYVDGRKRSLDHPALRPAGVVLEARFISALPARLSAVSGLDALCQCVESIWACGATAESRALAVEGGRLMAANLLVAAHDHEPEACRAIMLGAHLSGCAINTSRTTAAHAFSYGLTQRFGVPHGLAVALSLGWLAEWNAGVDEASCVHPAGTNATRQLVSEAASTLGVEPPGVGVAMRDLLIALGLPSTLHAVGVPREALKELSEAMDPARLANNPRRLTTNDVLASVIRVHEGG